MLSSFIPMLHEAERPKTSAELLAADVRRGELAAALLRRARWGMRGSAQLRARCSGWCRCERRGRGDPAPARRLLRSARKDGASRRADCSLPW